jgi:hypothetical protein
MDSHQLGIAVLCCDSGISRDTLPSLSSTVPPILPLLPMHATACPIYLTLILATVKHTGVFSIQCKPLFLNSHKYILINIQLVLCFHNCDVTVKFLLPNTVEPLITDTLINEHLQ